MGTWDVVGWLLVVIGVAEYALFRYLAPRRENIRRRMPLLVANSTLNMVVGLALVAFV